MESLQKHEYGSVVSKYLLSSNYISSIILDNIMWGEWESGDQKIGDFGNS